MKSKFQVGDLVYINSQIAGYECGFIYKIKKDIYNYPREEIIYCIRWVPSEEITFDEFLEEFLIKI